MNKGKSDSPIPTFLCTVMLTLLLTAIFPSTLKASDLVILYSNDIRGDTEPCG